MSNEAARRICSQAVTLAIMFTAPGVRLALCEGTDLVKISHVWRIAVNFDDLINYFVAVMTVWKT